MIMVFMIDMFRSFAPLRMTRLRTVVILSEAKDLFASSVTCIPMIASPSLRRGVSSRSVHYINRFCNSSNRS